MDERSLTTIGLKPDECKSEKNRDNEKHKTAE
jgi:hypothetical protein